MSMDMPAIMGDPRGIHHRFSGGVATAVGKVPAGPVEGAATSVLLRRHMVGICLLCPTNGGNP